MIEMLGNRKAAKEQRGYLNRAMETSGRAQRTAIDSTLSEANTLRPDQRMQAMQDQEDQTAGQLRSDLAGATTLESPVAGRQSDAYRQAMMTREAGEADRTSAIVRELAKMRAPGSVLQNEGLRRSNLAEALQSLWGTTNNKVRALSNDAEAVEPPWWGQAAKLGRQAATAYYTGGMG